MVAQTLDETEISRPVAPADANERIRRTSESVTQRAVADLEPPDRDEVVNRLIETNIEAAKSIAGRYRNRGVDVEDLEQVALLALTKAAQRFDPDAGHTFLSYATATIRGEIRHHFRDSGWMVRPPRRVQDLQANLRRAQQDLELALGRSPRPTELAAHLDEELNDVIEALSADGCFAPTSLDAPLAGGSVALNDVLGSEDRAFEAAEARALLAPALQLLEERDRQILGMRFIERRTQQQIADATGLTQANVSRRLVRILQHLRNELERPASCKA